MKTLMDSFVSTFQRKQISNRTAEADFSDEYIQEVQNKLNNRPRKTLNFQTPIEYLKNMKIAFEN